MRYIPDNSRKPKAKNIYPITYPYSLNKFYYRFIPEQLASFLLYRKNIVEIGIFYILVQWRPGGWLLRDEDCGGEVLSTIRGKKRKQCCKKYTLVYFYDIERTIGHFVQGFGKIVSRRFENY